MMLKSLTITRVMWGERQGLLDGEVIFMSPKGEIKALLTDDQLSGIMALCADALVLSTQAAASMMISDIINATGKELGYD